MRLRRFVIALPLALAVVAAFGGPVHAGGGRIIEFGERHYAWGQVAFGESDVEVGSCCPSGDVGDGPYRAYLVPPASAYDAPLPAGATYLGRLTVRSLSSSAAHASLRFVVPRVAPGDYYVRICNAGCAQELGDLFGSWINVVETPMEGRLLDAIATARKQLSQAFRKNDSALKRFADQVQEGAATASGQADLKTQVGELAARTRALEAEAAGARARAPWWAALGALAALAAGFLTVFARTSIRASRRRRAVGKALDALDVPSEPIPFELEPVD